MGVERESQWPGFVPQAWREGPEGGGMMRLAGPGHAMPKETGRSLSHRRHLGRLWRPVATD